MNFSVIIPVYNAAEYLQQAIDSALDQAETGEVLLIEDGSTDDSIRLCKSLAQNNTKIKWFQHPNGINLGPAASRNLGIKKALFDLIAFLDADDWYQPNRFHNAIKMFGQNSKIDGVYEAVGTSFENEEVRMKWHQRNNLDITTMIHTVANESLFETLLKGDSGYIHLNGLTLRKKIAQTADPFNDQLRFAEDTEYIIKLAHNARLYPGSIKLPVAIRRVHSSSSIHTASTDKRWQYKVKCYHSLLQWGLDQQLDTDKIISLAEASLKNAGTSPSDTPRTIKEYNFFKEMLLVFFKYPPVILYAFYWKRCLNIFKKIFQVFKSKKTLNKIN